MSSEQEHEKLISKKATFHQNCKVHITLKNSEWENGWIEEVGYDWLVLKFTDEGVAKNNTSNKVFFFLEIKDIDEFKEDRR